MVWGGSTSVGCNAIQLAVAAGYGVITTCSPRNFEKMARLGARAAFDYNSPTVVADIVAALRGHRLAGAFAIGTGSMAALLDIVGACPGAKFIASASQPAAFNVPASGRVSTLSLLPTLVRMTIGNARLGRKARRLGIRTKFIWGSSLQDNEVGPMIFARFLPQALADGRYAAAPEPLVVGHGLETIPKALEQLGKGVSARKLVVTL